MSHRKKLQVTIVRATVIPSLTVGVPENPQVGPDFLLKIRVYVENPESIVQLNVGRNLLIEAFKGIDFFNQDHTKVFSVTVSGDLDSMEPFAKFSSEYKGHTLSLLVSTMAADPRPLLDIPTSVRRLIQMDQNSETTDTIKQHSNITESLDDETIFKRPYPVPPRSISTQLSSSLTQKKEYHVEPVAFASSSSASHQESSASEETTSTSSLSATTKTDALPIFDADEASSSEVVPPVAGVSQKLSEVDMSSTSSVVLPENLASVPPNRSTKRQLAVISIEEYRKPLPPKFVNEGVEE